MDTLREVSQHNGPAGQIVVHATVQWSDEKPRVVRFFGHVLGGPVAMVGPSGHFSIVHAAERFGPVCSVDWVRAFYAHKARSDAA